MYVFKQRSAIGSYVQKLQVNTIDKRIKNKFNTYNLKKIYLRTKYNDWLYMIILLFK